MTGSDDPLTPTEEEVRRLLAESRQTGPTPPEVVARLDRVLDDLGHEPDRAAPVVDLARRRRRRAASVLVAAAAIGVVGFGVDQVVNSQGGADSLTSGSAESADRGTGSTPSKSGPGGANSGEEPVAPAPQKTTEGKSDLIRLRRDALSDGLVVARRGLNSFGIKADAGNSSADRAAGAACGADSWGRGRFVPVSYGGTPAVVVFRHPVGDTQVADIFLCGSSEPVRSVTLPAP